MKQFVKCVFAKVAAGKLTKEQANEAIDLVKQYERDNAGRMGAPQALSQAQAKAALELAERAAKLEQQTALQIAATADNLAKAAANPNGPARGVRDLIDRPFTGPVGHSNVELRQSAIHRVLTSMVADALNAYRPKSAGLTHDKLGLRNFVREVFGLSSGDSVAGAAAKGWKRATEYAVQRFNNAGGDIRALVNWRLPNPVHDRAAIKAAGDVWTSDLQAMVADGRVVIRDFETGRPATPEKAAKLIENARSSIVTDGLSDLVPGSAVGGRKVANARNDPRVFEFTSAESWLSYNDRYGRGDLGIYDAITGHLRGISRDTALIEVLGPNPDAMVRLLKDTAKKAGASDSELKGIQNSYDIQTGRANRPGSSYWASAFSGARQVVVSAKLGGAFLSSFADFATMRSTAQFNGIPAIKVMGRYLKLMNPASAADRLFAARQAMIVDDWVRSASAAQRHMAEEIGSGLPARVADVVMRLSLLTPHTANLQRAFGQEYLALLADNAGKAFTNLDEPIRRSLTAYGMDAGHWDTIRTSGLVDDGTGIVSIMPDQIVTQNGKAGLEAGTRLLEMIDGETGLAVINPGGRARAIMTQGQAPGTVAGELLRTGLQFKSFTVSMMLMHMGRGLYEIPGAQKGRYLAGLVLTTTAMGALSYQAKQITAGKDPRAMDDPKFWAAALVQGGGVGILGDLLYSGVTRADQGLVGTLMGPVPSTVDDLSRLTLGNVAPQFNDKDSNAGRELTRFLKNNTPGSTLWYTRLATDRLLWDRLQTLLDPNYAQSFQRTRDAAMRDYDQRFFWGPGRTMPERAPDLGAALPVR